MSATAIDRPMSPADPGDAGPAPLDDSPNQPEAMARVKRRTHHWSRVIHVYTSMIALLVVLFFAMTGLTLNHPDWTFGDSTTTTTATGTFPFDTELTTADGTTGGVDFLSISEYVRTTYDVRGDVDSFEATSTTSGTTGSIAFKNPGYSADLFFDVDTGDFELTVEQQGWVAVMNDLHKGRDTGSGWKWVIDVAAGFLVVISLSGLTMQLFLRRRRRPALLAAGAGAIALIVLVVITLR
jgi:uncharacterized protein